MLVFLLLVLGVSCILPVCSGLPFKLPFSNIYLCFCLSKKKLVNMEGVMLDNQESISEEVLGFFGKLYNVGEEDLWQLEGLDWSLI